MESKSANRKNNCFTLFDEKTKEKDYFKFDSLFLEKEKQLLKK